MWLGTLSDTIGAGRPIAASPSWGQKGRGVGTEGQLAAKLVDRIIQKISPGRPWIFRLQCPALSLISDSEPEPESGSGGLWAISPSRQRVQLIS